MKIYFNLAITLVVVITLSSCEKPMENGISIDAPQSDSVSLLYAVGGGGFTYNTDTIPDKIFSIIPSGSSIPDTTYIYYNSDKKVSRLMSLGKTADFIPLRYKIYDLAIYDQGRISKVYTKRRVYESEPEYDDPSYAFTVGPLTPHFNIYSYDSIVYDNMGRLSKNYHYNSENAPSGGYRFYLIGYDILEYYNPYTQTDSLLYSVKRYGASGSPDMEIYFKEYELYKVNPLYKTFKEKAFFRNIGHIHKYFVPQYTISTGIDIYITLNPHPLKKLYAATVGGGIVWQDYNLQNVFDIYGNLISSSYTSAYTTGNVLGYNYIRKRK